MATIHGGQSQMDAIKTSVSKKANLPSDIPPEAMPTPEFMEVAAQIDNPTPEPSKPELPVNIPNNIPEPIKLTYKYEGLHSCGNSVKTIMIDAGGELWANAYCLICNQTVSQIKVHPIPPGEVGQKEVKDAKSNGNELLDKAPLQNKVPNTRVPSSKK